MPYSVRLMTRDDLPYVTDISVTAFLDDELFAWLAPRSHEYPHSWRSYMSARNRMHMSARGVWGVVCIDEHKVVVGYAWWQRAVPPSKPELFSTDIWLQRNASWTSRLEFALLNLESKYDMLCKLNPASSYDHLHLLRSTVDDCMQPLEQSIPHWHLKVLAVAPQAQRTGVGGMLVDWGINQARSEAQQTGHAVPISLTSSPHGLGLYRKKGFRVIAWQKLVLDERFGLTASIGGAAMVHDPTSTWIRPADPGSEAGSGRPLDVTWTDKALYGVTKD